MQINECYIKEYFNKNCISIRAWAKKHGLNSRTAYMVINKEVVGSWVRKNSPQLAVYEALLKDGIIKKIPQSLKKAS